MAKLEVLSGKRKGKTYDVPDAGEVSIGNRKSAGITLRDPWISFKHAKICGESGSFFIEDLGSSNGTWIDGQKIQRQELSAGQLVYFGKTKTRFLTGDEVVGPAPADDPGDAPWWDKVIDGAGPKKRTGARARRLQTELEEERRMREALEKFLDLPTGSVVGDVARAGALEKQVAELTQQLAEASQAGNAELEKRATDAKARAEEETTKRLEVEGKLQLTEDKVTDLEGRLAGKDAELEDAVAAAKEPLEAELAELKTSLEDARKRASEQAAGGDEALTQERERADGLESDLAEWRGKARGAAGKVAALEKDLAAARAEAEKAAQSAGAGADADALRAQLSGALAEATRWREEAEKAKEEAAHWEEEHGNIVAEIDEISQEQIEVEDELKAQIAELEAKLEELGG